MKSVVLIAGAPIDLNVILSRYQGIGSCTFPSPERLRLEENSNWFAIDNDTAVRAEYSVEELATVEQLFPSPCLALLEFNSPQAARMAIGLLSADATLFVDNDHGRIQSIVEIGRRFAGTDDWYSEFG